MGSLSNLYISQSYQSLIHLGSDTTITTASVQLQDGFGNGTGIFVNSLGNVFLSGSLTASLTEGYAWVGDGNNRTKLVSTSSFGGGTTDLTSLNAFTSSQNTKNSTLASYTGSNDTKWNTLGGQTGSYVTSAITASSLVTASVNLNTITFTKGNGTTFAVTVNTGSAGATTDISSLNAFTSSQETKNATLGGLTGSFATTGSNSFVGNEEITGSLIVTYPGNTGNPLIEANSSLLRLFNASVNPLQIGNFNGNIDILAGGGSPYNTLNAYASINQDPTATYSNQNNLQTTKIWGSLTASLQEGYVWVGNSSGKTTTVATSSFAGGGTIPTGTISSSAQITSLGFVSSSVTASSLVTASFSVNTLTFTKGDGTTFGVVIPDVSGSTGNFATTGSNVFVGNQTISGSLFVSGSEVLTGTLSASSLRVENNTYLDGQLRVTNDAQFDTHILVQGAQPHLKLRDTSGGGFSSGYDIRIDTGSFEIHDDTHNRDVLSDFFDSASASHTTSLTSEIIVISGSTSVTLIGNISASIISASTINGLGDPLTFSTSVDSRLDGLEAATSSYVTSAITASSLVTASFSGNTLTFTKGDSSTFGVVIPDISGSTIDTGSFATTGSNVFIGDQTLSDGSGNNSTISPYSGSLVLVSKGVTSGSAGLSNVTSSANLVNLIFKSANTQSGSITISGSNNILQSPNAPTAGFRRLIGSQNILLTTVSPEVTGSLTYSPTISSNYANSVIRFRGPASSSAWTFNNNIVNGNLNLGNADATSANQAIAGGQINTNILLAAVNYNAYTTPLVAQAIFSSNLSVGNSTLTAFSSSINAQNNIFVGNTFTVNNRYFGASSTAAAQRLSLQNNIFGGLATPTLSADGSNTTAANPREVHGNTTNGSQLAIGVVLNGDNSNLYSTLIHGSNLTVTGSNAYNTPASAGSTFIGRNNDRNGTKASSGETIFAVGTGTGTGARKTGFLIDSGSNTFVEGTLNVSGATSINGTLNISGAVSSAPYALSITSLTASLDASLASTYTLALVSGSTTHILLSGQKIGQTYNLLVTQPASGTGSIQMGPFIYQPSGSSYVPTPTSNAEDILTFVTFNNTAKTYIANVTNFI
jgi:cytoskeletal protein CcmA (bactofilin family)